MKKWYFPREIPKSSTINIIAPSERGYSHHQGCGYPLTFQAKSTQTLIPFFFQLHNGTVLYIIGLMECIPCQLRSIGVPYCKGYSDHWELGICSSSKCWLKKL